MLKARNVTPQLHSLSPRAECPTLIEAVVATLFLQQQILGQSERETALRSRGLILVGVRGQESLHTFEAFRFSTPIRFGGCRPVHARPTHLVRSGHMRRKVYSIPFCSCRVSIRSRQVFKLERAKVYPVGLYSPTPKATLALVATLGLTENQTTHFTSSLVSVHPEIRQASTPSARIRCAGRFC